MSDLHRKMMERNGLSSGSVHVTVQVTVEVTVGAWGVDCTIAQAAAQAVETAEGALRKALGTNPYMQIKEATTLRVVCEAEKQ